MPLVLVRLYLCSFLTTLTIKLHLSGNKPFNTPFANNGGIIQCSILNEFQIQSYGLTYV